MGKAKIAGGAICSVMAIIAIVVSNGQVRTNHQRDLSLSVMQNPADVILTFVPLVF
jgi:hypothetical protein